MCTRGLPDIYTFSPRACGPRASGVYIRQTTRAHGITTKCTYKLMVSVLLPSRDETISIYWNECLLIKIQSQLQF